jgi:hypothetical protein
VRREGAGIRRGQGSSHLVHSDKVEIGSVGSGAGLWLKGTKTVVVFTEVVVMVDREKAGSTTTRSKVWPDRALCKWLQGAGVYNVPLLHTVRTETLQKFTVSVQSRDELGKRGSSDCKLQPSSSIQLGSTTRLLSIECPKTQRRRTREEQLLSGHVADFLFIFRVASEVRKLTEAGLRAGRPSFESIDPVSGPLSIARVIRFSNTTILTLPSPLAGGVQDGKGYRKASDVESASLVQL